MNGPSDYLVRATTFERAAEKNPDPQEREQLRTIADTYVTLAKSTRILEQSADVVERLKRKK